MNCIFPRNYPSVTCRVSLLDSTEKVIEVNGNQKVWVLLHNLLDEMKLIAKEYFGLKFMDKYKQWHWMNLNRSVYPQLKNAYIERRRVCFDSNTFDVKLGLKYYPRDPCSIPDEMTRYQIFLQIRQDIIDGQLQIEKYLLASLGGLILQSDCGDCSQKLNDNYVKECLPVPGLNQQLENMMKETHKQLQGTTPDRAEYQLLDKIKWLDNYGMIKFPVKDESENYSFLGLTPTGVVIERPNRKLVNYYWPRISGFSAYRQTLTIKVRDNKKGSTLKFQTGTKEMCRELWKLCSEHLAFYKSTQDSLTTSYSVVPPKRISSGKSSASDFYVGNKANPESGGYTSGSDFDRATPPSTVVSDFPMKPHNYLSRQYVSDVESEPTRRLHPAGLQSRTINSQPGSACSSSTAIGTDVIYNADRNMAGVFSEPNQAAYNNLKRSKKKRHRSNSPNKSRLPNEILEHIKFEQVEPSDLSQTDPRDIPYTKVETKEQPLKIRYSPSMKSKGRSHFKSRPPPVEILPQSSGPVEPDFSSSSYPYHVKTEPAAPIVKPVRSVISAHSDWSPYRPMNNASVKLRSTSMQPNVDPGFMSDSGLVNPQYRGNFDDLYRRAPNLPHHHSLMYQHPNLQTHYQRQSRPLPNPHSHVQASASFMTSSPKSNVTLQSGNVHPHHIIPQNTQVRYPLSAPQQMDYRC